MLKMLMLKNQKNPKQCIAIVYYKRKLSLFGKDDTRQAKSLIFIVVPQAEQAPKVKKNLKRCSGNLFHFKGPKKRKQVLTSSFFC